MSYAKLTKREESIYKDYATLEEREWLDRYQRVFPYRKDVRMGADGSLYVRAHKGSGFKFGVVAGCYDRASTMAYVKGYVTMRENEIAENERLWIENNPGWGI